MSTQVTKMWWDGEKVMAEPIPESELYEPVAETEQLFSELHAARREIEYLRRALANESLAHRDTQQRYMHLVKNMADSMAMHVNPPMLIVREGEIDRKALEEIMARGAQ